MLSLWHTREVREYVDKDASSEQRSKNVSESSFVVHEIEQDDLKEVAHSDANIVDESATITPRVDAKNKNRAGDQSNCSMSSPVVLTTTPTKAIGKCKSIFRSPAVSPDIINLAESQHAEDFSPECIASTQASATHI